MNSERFENNVFINCPFDSAYIPILRPLIYTIVYLGFTPRIALESSNSGKPRLEKLLELIKESKYSIHDLSRLQSKKPNEFYRLNMPFELGLDFAAMKFDENLKEKKFLIIETKQYNYMKALSDINGLDVKNHNDSPEQIIGCVQSWFIETVGLRNVHTAMKIWYDYNEFSSKLFENKFDKYKEEHDKNTAKEMAKEEIEKMPIPEFIDEIKNYFN